VSVRPKNIFLLPSTPFLVALSPGDGARRRGVSLSFLALDGRGFRRG